MLIYQPGYCFMTLSGLGILKRRKASSEYSEHSLSIIQYKYYNCSSVYPLYRYRDYILCNCFDCLVLDVVLIRHDNPMGWLMFMAFTSD